MGMFDPEPEPGDRWRWAAVAVVVVAGSALLDSRDWRPAVDLVIVGAGVLFLVLAFAGLLRLLR